jgi:hypothetical protein
VVERSVRISLESTVGLSLRARFSPSDRWGSDNTLFLPPRAYDPLTWPAWNFEIAYQMPRPGRLVFGLQQPHYLENLSPCTGFRSTAFQIRWEYSFELEGI